MAKATAMHDDINARGRLAGKNAVVTGAAGDIGLAASIQLAREGAAVLMAGRTRETLLDAVSKVKESLAEGARATARVEWTECDVSRESDVERMMGHVDSWGGIDILFNNAAHVSAQDGGVFEASEDVWDRSYNVNVKGVWFGCKHAVLNLRKHGKTGGSIVNNASIVAMLGSAIPQVAYTASKGAVLAMTRELAICHAHEGFRFNSLVPGPVRTSALDALFARDAQGRGVRAVHWPMGRLAESIEIAHALIFLASDESSFITGTDFVVDGGLTKAYITGTQLSYLDASGGETIH